jgi:ribonuclease HI
MSLKNSFSSCDPANPNKCALEIFTDGACSGNPGPGGWGAVIYSAPLQQQDDQTRHPSRPLLELMGGVLATTNNRMEMTAPIQALEWLYQTDLIGKNHLSTVYIYSDSKYLVDGISKWIIKWERNGWRTASGNPVENQDLWKHLRSLEQSIQEKFLIKPQWFWVRGHDGHLQNEQADALAQKGLASLRA